VFLAGIGDHGDNRPEDLLLCNGRVRIHIREHRWLDVPATSDVRAPTAFCQPGAFFPTGLDVAFYELALPLTDQRPDVGGLVPRVPDGHGIDERAHTLDKLVLTSRRDEKTRLQGADLTVVAERS